MERDAGQDRDEGAGAQAEAEDAPAPRHIPRAVVLARKGYGSLRKGIDEAKGDKLKILRGGGACDAIRTEAVDGALDHDVGK